VLCHLNLSHASSPVGSPHLYRINWGLEFGTAPNSRREQAQLCTINCRLELAQPQLQKWARCSTAAFPKMFTCRKKQSQIPPVPNNYNVSPLPPRTAAPSCVVTVYNKLAGGGGGWCVSILVPSLPGPSFVHVWSSVCCPFCISHCPQLGFQNKFVWDVRGGTRQGPESGVMPGWKTNYKGTWSLRQGDTLQEAHTLDVRNK
jgi:hypothetical protein